MSPCFLIVMTRSVPFYIDQEGMTTDDIERVKKLNGRHFGHGYGKGESQQQARSVLHQYPHLSKPTCTSIDIIQIHFD